MELMGAKNKLATVVDWKVNHIFNLGLETW